MNFLPSLNNDSILIITTILSTRVQSKLIGFAPNPSIIFHDISVSNNIGYSFENESVSNIVNNH